MTPLVVAHRGASAAHPPGNTVAAFEAAGPLGADWVELDVRRTLDGELAVHHDAHLTDGRAIVEVAAASLPADVPLLSMAMAACGTLGVNVEIKSDPSEPDWEEGRGAVDLVLDQLADCDREKVLVTSFDPMAIAKVRTLDPSLDTGLLAFDLSDVAAVVARAVRGGHRALNPWDHMTDQHLVAMAHEAGLEVNVWTVDDPVRMVELIGFGVAGIITNVPDVLRNLLDRPD